MNSIRESYLKRFSFYKDSLYALKLIVKASKNFNPIPTCLVDADSGEVFERKVVSNAIYIARHLELSFVGLYTKPIHTVENKCYVFQVNQNELNELCELIKFIEENSQG
jgi:hypothetical protein